MKIEINEEYNLEITLENPTEQIAFEYWWDSTYVETKKERAEGINPDRYGGKIEACAFSIKGRMNLE
jgi:hypothetical protein